LSKSFLIERSEISNINGSISYPLNAENGVPEGSILNHLFIIIIIIIIIIKIEMAE